MSLMDVVKFFLSGVSTISYIVGVELTRESPSYSDFDNVHDDDVWRNNIIEHWGIIDRCQFFETSAIPF